MCLCGVQKRLLPVVQQFPRLPHFHDLLLDKPMDEIINWFILIIIFVFDPLAVALVVAFNNALKIDKGENDKKKVVEKRELYGEEPDKSEDENRKESDLWDNTLQDGLEDEEWDESHGLDQVLNDIVSEEEVMAELEVEDEELPHEARGVKPPNEIDVEKKSLIQQALKNESKKETINDGYDLTEEEVEEYYQKEGWKNPYNGKPYYTHPRFDWNIKERWINDRNAINYWMKKKGGTTQELNELKEKYPSDFTSKTY